MNAPQRVLILSGVRLFCEGLALRLAAHKQLNVIGFATSLNDAQARVREHHPDVLLIDASAQDFLRIVSSLRQMCNAVVVAFAVGDEETEAIACAEAGVNAFVERDASVDDLLRAVAECSRGEVSLSPRLVGALFRRVGFLARMASGAPPAALTLRESEIYSLLRQGFANKDIAARLGISLPTVKNHVRRVLEKLGLHRRSEAAALPRRIAEPQARYTTGLNPGTDSSLPLPRHAREKGPGSKTAP